MDSELLAPLCVTWFPIALLVPIGVFGAVFMRRSMRQIDESVALARRQVELAEAQLEELRTLRTMLAPR